MPSPLIAATGDSQRDGQSFPVTTIEVFGLRTFGTATPTARETFSGGSIIDTETLTRTAQSGPLFVTTAV
jgi:hypothetical protein